MWLFLKRWGELPRNGGARVIISIYFSYLEPISGLFPLASYRVFHGGRAGSIREGYRDLAHIIHQRFCYNRRCLTQVNRAEKVRQAGTRLTRQVPPPFLDEPFINSVGCSLC
jgi:hypothetical protein